VLYTPPITAAILPGITRDTVITLANDLGLRVREEMLPRELLYISDEAFFVGTAAEITPIRSVDKIQIGNGKRGPVTETIQQAFFKVINGEAPDRHGWLTFVYPGEPVTKAAPGPTLARAARQ
jgi:branched-chain amino acid aminotransferase